MSRSDTLKLDEADIVNFDQGFKYLGVTFLRSMIMVPFDRPQKEREGSLLPPASKHGRLLSQEKKGMVDETVTSHKSSVTPLFLTRYRPSWTGLALTLISGISMKLNTAALPLPVIFRRSSGL